MSTDSESIADMFFLRLPTFSAYGLFMNSVLQGSDPITRYLYEPFLQGVLRKALPSKQLGNACIYLINNQFLVTLLKNVLIYLL